MNWEHLKQCVLVLHPTFFICVFLDLKKNVPGTCLGDCIIVYCISQLWQLEWEHQCSVPHVPAWKAVWNMRQLHGVGRGEIPISVLTEQQVPPSGSYKEATSASCSSCPVKQTTFKTKQWTAFVFTLCILNICNHIFSLSMGTSEPKFAAGAKFCSFRIPLLQFSPEWPWGNRAVLRGLFLLYIYIYIHTLPLYIFDSVISQAVLCTKYVLFQMQ